MGTEACTIVEGVLGSVVQRKEIGRTTWDLAPEVTTVLCSVAYSTDGAWSCSTLVRWRVVDRSINGQ